MSDAPALPIRLFGTLEPAPPPRILRAGALTAELDAGNLRHIRLAGVELIRAISFIVRDRNWGTYNPVIRDLTVQEEEDGFLLTYEATAGDAAQSLTYSARIAGKSDGSVSFEVTAQAQTAFLTNRTGFVVLHPIICVSGRPVRVEHADGTLEDTRFPDRIDPVQPMMNLRALTHEAAPGLSVTCRMEGDVFEMEDQRNWTDASYKTYVRPLSLPWPYTLAEGERLEQAVRLSVDGTAPAAAAQADLVVALGDAPVGTVPPLGAGLDPAEVPALTGVPAPGLAYVICHYNPAQGHGFEDLRRMAEAASSIGAEPWLEAVIVSVTDYGAEIAALGQAVRAIGAPFRTVALSPAPDLKCTLPGSPWPPAPPPEAFFEAARKAFPGVRLAGGMFSTFTELNRKNPPTALLDLITFTTTATLHAGDDHSIMEGLESLPAMAASAAHIAGGKPFVVGPSAIGMRMNPYGEAPMANPGNIRQAMNYNDPRHRGLLGAAWTLGFISRFADGGAAAIAMGDLAGPAGLFARPQNWPQPFFDEGGGLFPVFHVMRGLSSLNALPRLPVSHPDTVEALAARRGSGVELWLANRTGAHQTIRVPAVLDRMSTLDADSFRQAAGDADHMDHAEGALTTGRVEMGPYAVLRLRGG